MNGAALNKLNEHAVSDFCVLMELAVQCKRSGIVPFCGMDTETVQSWTAVHSDAPVHRGLTHTRGAAVSFFSRLRCL